MQGPGTSVELHILTTHLYKGESGSREVGGTEELGRITQVGQREKWSYFDRDDERARHALVSASPQVRSRMALLGYWYAHLAMIAGIVLIATGVKHVVASSGGPIQAAAWLLAGGMALYLCGDAWFRRVMGIRPVLVRALGAVIVLASGGVGLLWGGEAEIGAIATLAVVLLGIEQRLEQRRETVQNGALHRSRARCEAP